MTIGLGFAARTLAGVMGVRLPARSASALRAVEESAALAATEPPAAGAELRAANINAATDPSVAPDKPGQSPMVWPRLIILILAVLLVVSAPHQHALRRSRTPWPRCRSYYPLAPRCAGRVRSHDD